MCDHDQLGQQRKYCRRINVILTDFYVNPLFFNILIINYLN